jgi:hypothetical protein
MMPLSGIIDRLSFRDKLVRKAAKATAKAKTAVKETEDAEVLPEEPEKE